MSKQTAVEFLVIKFKEIVKVFDIDENQLILLLDAIKTSKEMEKEQIKEAYMSALPYGLEYSHYDKYANKYYNEIYKKEDK
jgi:hypothetical protein